MRHETILSTDPNLWQPLLAFLREKGEKIEPGSGDYNKIWPILKWHIKWWVSAYTEPHTITDSEFLIKYGNTPKRGDWVEVRDLDSDEWEKRIFVEKVGKMFRCVWKGWESDYRKGKDVSTTEWQQMRPIPQPIQEPSQEDKDRELLERFWKFSYPGGNGKETIEKFLKAERETHIRNNTVAFKLSDLLETPAGYFIDKDKAEEILNQKLNGNPTM